VACYTLSPFVLFEHISTATKPIEGPCTQNSLAHLAGDQEMTWNPGEPAMTRPMSCNEFVGRNGDPAGSGAPQHGEKDERLIPLADAASAGLASYLTV